MDSKRIGSLIVLMIVLCASCKEKPVQSLIDNTYGSAIELNKTELSIVINENTLIPEKNTRSALI